MGKRSRRRKGQSDALVQRGVAGEASGRGSAAPEFELPSSTIDAATAAAIEERRLAAVARRDSKKRAAASGGGAMAQDLIEYFDVACENGHVDTVRVFLAYGADVHKAANGNRTPLHAAAYGGHTEVARLLLASGADIDREDEDGKTPMALAEDRGHCEMVTLLVERKAGAQVDTCQLCEMAAVSAKASWKCPICGYGFCPACLREQLTYRKCGPHAKYEFVFKCPCECGVDRRQIVGHSDEFEAGENSVFKHICAILAPLGPILLKHDDDRENSILFAAFKPRTRCGSKCRGCAKSSIVGLPVDPSMPTIGLF